MRQDDEKKSFIIDLIYKEKRKAIENNNTKLYAHLIQSNYIKLHESDIKFMDQNKDFFASDKRYLYYKRFNVRKENSFQQMINETKERNILNSKNSSFNKNHTPPLKVILPQKSKHTNVYKKSNTSKKRKYTCSQITKEEAYSLLNKGHTYLDRDHDGIPCESRK